MGTALMGQVNGKKVFLTDKRIVELALPGYVLRVCVGTLVRGGFEFRQDVLIMLDRSSVRYLTHLKPGDIRRVGLRIEAMGSKMFRETCVEDGRAASVVYSRLFLGMRDEGRLMEPDDEALSVAALILSDVEQDTEGWGDLTGVLGSVNKLRDLLLREGLYHLSG